MEEPMNKSLSQNMDMEKIEAGVRMILEGVGENPDREGLLETPARVARMYQEIFAGMNQEPHELFETLFDEHHQEMVLVREIPFYSVCEHHLVPFFGHAHIAYIPGKEGKVCGLSKLARLVDLYAKRPQVQELHPQGVMVVLEAEHMCMTMRGVKKPGSKTTTSAARGIFLSNEATRAEAMSLIFR